MERGRKGISRKKFLKDSLRRIEKERDRKGERREEEREEENKWKNKERKDRNDFLLQIWRRKRKRVLKLY